MVDLDGGFVAGGFVDFESLLLDTGVEEDEVEAIEFLGALAECEDAVEGVHIEWPDLDIARWIGL